METISITQIRNTTTEEITQVLSEKIDAAGSQIENTLLSGSIESATDTIRDLTNSFEDLVWEVYLINLLKCKEILIWLRAAWSSKSAQICVIPTNYDYIAEWEQNSS